MRAYRVSDSEIQWLPYRFDLFSRSLDDLVRDPLFSAPFGAVGADNGFVTRIDNIFLDSVHVENATASFVMSEIRELACVRNAVVVSPICERISIEHTKHRVF